MIITLRIIISLFVVVIVKRDTTLIRVSAPCHPRSRYKNKKPESDVFHAVIVPNSSKGRFATMRIQSGFKARFFDNSARVWIARDFQSRGSDN